MQIKYASLWERIYSKAIDLSIIYFVTAVFYILYQTPHGTIFVIIGGMSAYAIPIYLLYTSILDSMGGTIGKRIANIKPVTEKTGNPPNVFRSFFHAVVLFPLFFLLVYLPASFFPESIFNDGNVAVIILAISVFIFALPIFGKQALHDYFSSIVVIKSK
jgi:uncharacterized RDD family membrane protein YckC